MSAWFDVEEEEPYRLHRVEEYDGDYYDAPPPTDADVPPELRAAPKGEPDDLFRTWTPGSLLGADRSFRWLANGLVVEPTYGMIAGPKKSLKSYVGTFIDVGIAAGVPIFGQFKVPESRPVVNYVGEGGRVPFTRRLERIADAMGVKLADLPMLCSFDVAPIGSDPFKESLRRDLASFGTPGLFHLDPYYAYHGARTDSRNLHEEGSLLSSISSTCVEEGWSALVTNHFNSTGTGRDLDRITQSGGAEWSDTWMLLGHREPPRVDEGSFRLVLEVGSRQWGGTTWDLDMELGRFDPETGEFEGAITWEIRRATGDGVAARRDEIEEAILNVLSDHPYEFTRTAVLEKVKGNAKKARSGFDRLVANGRIRSQFVDGGESDRRVVRERWGRSSDLTPDELRPNPDEWGRG